MPKPGTERAVVDCATDLEQQINATPRPSHLLGLVHTPVDQEVRYALGDRGSDPPRPKPRSGLIEQGWWREC
jgi:hypothetical protein